MTLSNEAEYVLRTVPAERFAWSMCAETGR